MYTGAQLAGNPAPPIPDSNDRKLDPKDGGGYFRLFKNGKEVINYEGPIWHDEKQAGPYFKVGMYRGAAGWKGEEADSILFFDELRMGGAKATKDQVDPAKQK